MQHMGITAGPFATTWGASRSGRPGSTAQKPEFDVQHQGHEHASALTLRSWRQQVPSRLNSSSSSGGGTRVGGAFCRVLPAWRSMCT